MDREVDFLAVDEIQLAAHDRRGHVFTERLLHARGREETWFMGSDTMRPLVSELLPTAVHAHCARLSRLSCAGASQARAPAAAERRGGLLPARGLRPRRAAAGAARRRGGGAGRALAAHAQRAGGALPGGRGRLPGRHRRHRHGAQPRRRARRLRVAAQVRRPRRSRARRPPRSPRSPAAPAATCATAPSAPSLPARLPEGVSAAVEASPLPRGAPPLLAQPGPRPRLARRPPRLARGAPSRSAASSSSTTPTTPRRWPASRSTPRCAPAPAAPRP